MDGSTPERRTTRVNFDLPEKAFSRLVKLKDDTEAVTYAEVVRAALRLYEAFYEASARGDEIIVRRPDGSEFQYKVF